MHTHFSRYMSNYDMSIQSTRNIAFDNASMMDPSCSIADCFAIKLSYCFSIFHSSLNHHNACLTVWINLLIVSIATPTIIINEVPQKTQDCWTSIRLTIIAGNTAIRARNKDPGKLSRHHLVEVRSFNPGLTPG
jgi:hypothetical protein